MKRILLFPFIVLTLAGAPASAQYRLAKPVPVQRTDFFFMTSDGMILDCTKFVPQSLMPPKGWPALVYCHGYADSKLTELDNAQAQAAYGMYTLCYSMRGQGLSGGLSNLISTLEMRDLQELIDYVKKDTYANPDRVGIFGASQGGILPFMAACNGMDVRCILSDVCSPSFSSNWIQNGSVKMTLFFSVDYDSTLVRYAPSIKAVRRWILSKQTSAWDSLAAYLPQQRDFLAQVPLCRTPMLLTNAWQDKFFDCSGVIAASSKLTVPFRLYCGAMDAHGADSTARENAFISKFDNTWIEHWLNDSNNGILDSARFQYAASHYPFLNKRWSWTHVESVGWPPDSLTPHMFYFHRDSTLTLVNDAAATDTMTLLNTVRDPTMTMQSAIDAQFTGLTFRARFEKNAITFTSAPLQTGMLFTGAPSLRLRYASTAAVCQFTFQIWEVRPTNEERFVSRINFTDRHCKPGSVIDTVIAGIPHSHIFLKGDRIRIVVTNLDTNPDDRFLLTNPHVLPILVNATNEIFIGGKNATCLMLPMQELALTDAAPVAALPAALRLSSNYPNPFHESTTITVELTQPSHARILVYDLLGRAALPPQETFFDAGAHPLQIRFPESAPTGAYFMTVTTERGVVTQTMQHIR